MRKFMPISSAVLALIITSVLSGCGGTSVEPVTRPTTRTGAAQTSSAAQTTDSAAATAEAPAAVKAAEVAAVAKAAIAAEAAKAKIAAAAKAKIAAAAKAKIAAAAKAKIAAAAKAGAADKAVTVQQSATLRETCSKVEKAVSGLSGKSSPPTAPELDAALAQVKLLNRAGDTETRNALSALLEALPGFRDEDAAGVVNDGRVAFLDSLAKLATRCEAVGSSALRWVG